MRREPYRVVLLVTKFKLALLASQCRLSLTDDALKQRIMTLFGNLAD